jgi:VWFA-related protein
MMLQGFTSDAASLKAAVNSSDAAAASGLLTDPSGMGGDSPLVHQSRQGKALQLELRDRYTLEAIDELAHYLGQFPGRKNLIWFAGSFPLSIIPDVSLGRTRGTDIEAEDRRRETNNLLGESRVAVYPADSRAQPAPFGTDASVSGPEYVKKPGLFAADASVSLQNEDIDHGTMERLAHDTGGAAFYNTNGLGQAIAHAIAEGSSYYTLSYQPDSDTKSNLAAEYRRIEVKIAGGPYLLSYRRGFYIGDVAASSGQSGTPASQSSIEAAMRRGAPDASEIVFKARVLPMDSRPEQSAGVNNKPDPKAKGPWQLYRVDIAADPRPLHWNKMSEDGFAARLEFAAVVFDQEGRAVNSLSDTVAVNLSKAKLLEATRTGVPLFSRVSVPVHGTYWLRIGIRDSGTGHLGTVEVPISLVKDLPAMVSEP